MFFSYYSSVFFFIARAMKRKGTCFCIGIGIRYYDRALREILMVSP